MEPVHAAQSITQQPSRANVSETALGSTPFEPPRRQLARSALTGVVANMAQNLAGRVALLAGQLVLARLLAPADFGVIALASTISSIASALVYFGIDQILQQRGHSGRFWATQVFVVSLAFAVFGAGVMCVFGMIGGLVFHNALLPRAMVIIAVATPLAVLSTVPQAALGWSMRFKFQAGYAAFDVFATQALIVLFAWLGAGPYSFFLPLLITNSLKAAVFWKVSGVRLRPLSRSRGWIPLTLRGVSALGTRIAMVLITQGDFLTLGLFAPTPVVGAYFFAFRLSAQPLNLLSGSITSVLFSALLKVEDKASRARIAFMTCETVGAVTIPLCFLLATVAEPGMDLLFGQKWRAATPIIQILSLGLPFDSIAWPAAAFLVAEGEFKRLFLFQTWSLPLFFAFVITGALFGSGIGVALGVSLYYFIHPLGYTTACFMHRGVGIRTAVLVFLRLLVCGLASFGPIYLLLTYSPLHDSRLAAVAFGVLAGPPAYLAALYLFSRSTFKSVVAQAEHVMGRPIEDLTRFLPFLAPRRA
jgi:PST family polysaccharide transporter